MVKLSNIIALKGRFFHIFCINQIYSPGVLIIFRYCISFCAHFNISHAGNLMCSSSFLEFAFINIFYTSTGI